jgi:hypothetical protein
MLDLRGLATGLTVLVKRPPVVEDCFEDGLLWTSLGTRDRAAKVGFEGVFRSVEGCGVGI